MGNILKNSVECTCEEFVAEVAGKRRKPYLDALKSTFKTIVLGKSTLVKEMSSFLQENEILKKAEAYFASQSKRGTPGSKGNG